MKTRLSLIAVLIILISACSATNTLTLSVTTPAPVFIPSTVENVGVLDRSLPTEKNQGIDKLDKILSAEGKNFDKDGAENAVKGLFNELGRNEKFRKIELLENVDVRSPGLGVFPSAMSWERVEEICDQNEVDILFVLSFYDTDSQVEYSSAPVEINGPLGIKVPGIEHTVRVRTQIKTGWRIYSPRERIIYDEYLINQNINTVGRGINPLKAAEAIVGRKESVMDVSRDMGIQYAFRILPNRIRVSRQYFVRGTNNFKIGKRRAQTGDWDGAADLWERELEHPRRKVAGRAHYNMGIINEINGDLEAALDWVSKSYTDYRNKEALRYLNILKFRVRQAQELEAQRTN